MNRALRAGLPWLYALGIGAAGELALRSADFWYPAESERVLLLSRQQDEQMRCGTGLLRLDPNEIWTLQPGAEIPNARGERVNAAGYRGPEVPAKETPGVLRIAVIGGGAAFATGVRWEDSFCAHLAQFLRERGVQAEVVAAGVPRASIRQALERYRHVVRPLHPDVLVSAFMDDMGYQPAPGGISDGDKIQLLRSFESGGGGGPSVRRRLRMLHLTAWISDLMSGKYWNERFVDLEEMRLEESMGSASWPGVRRVPLPDFEASFDALRGEAEADGSHMVAMSIPRVPAVPGMAIHAVYMKTLAGWAARSGVPLLDARDAYLAAVQSGEIRSDELSIADGFPSPRAHLVIARALADEIARRREAWGL